MKPKYLLLLLFFLEGCEKKPNFFSFQNKWGVVCYFDQIHMEPQRTVFLPLEDPADSTSITSASSIFDFKFGSGMDYHDRGHSESNHKIYWISDHKKALSENYDPKSKIYWAFAKLKYHAVTRINEPSTSRIFRLTLINKNDQLPVKTYYFNKGVAVDTVYFKKKYVDPISDSVKLLFKLKYKNDQLKYKNAKKGSVMPR